MVLFMELPWKSLGTPDILSKYSNFPPFLPSLVLILMQPCGWAWCNFLHQLFFHFLISFRGESWNIRNWIWNSIKSITKLGFMEKQHVNWQEMSENWYMNKACTKMRVTGYQSNGDGPRVPLVTDDDEIVASLRTPSRTALRTRKRIRWVPKYQFGRWV